MKMLLSQQGVKAALLTIGASEIELLEPITPGTGVARFLEHRGEGLHHICFETDDVYRELEAAKTRGIAVIDQHPRRGLAGLICFGEYFFIDVSYSTKPARKPVSLRPNCRPLRRSV